jgi:hypothetical protein
MAQPQVSDVGFGYVNKHESVEMPDTDYNPPLTATMPKSPLKSAMKTPGAPSKNLEAILSPTFKEEQMLEKHETYTEKQQAKDLVSDVHRPRDQSVLTFSRPLRLAFESPNFSFVACPSLVHSS